MISRQFMRDCTARQIVYHRQRQRQGRMTKDELKRVVAYIKKLYLHNPTVLCLDPPGYNPDNERDAMHGV